MDVLLLRESEVRALITPAIALRAVRDAFRALAEGRAVQPASFDLDVPRVSGEFHVKGAYIEGLAHFAVKSASGFYGNRERGLPVSSGMSLAFDAATGELRALILDNGWLTELRTGAAGALAADLLAIPDPDVIGIIGAGVQARFQLQALLGVRRPRKVLAWSRNLDGAQRYAAEMSEATGICVEVAPSAETLVRASQIVVTTTPARAPIVRAEWIAPGTHITAMGSDLAGKQELDVAVLARADLVVADRKDNCLRSGEIGCAVRAGALDVARVVELGDIVVDRRLGRSHAGQITIADQCGLGICDTAVADAVVVAALKEGAGTRLAL
jgi:ornithine cyclodeaminase